MSSPAVQIADLSIKLNAVGAPTADVDRWVWQQQLDVAEATARVQARQINLLQAQRDILDDQLADATRKYDEAQRQIELARDMLGEVGK